MKVKFWTPGREDVGVDAAEIDHVLRRIESGHQIAAIADGEIGENVRALTAEQKLLAVTTDKIRFAGARTQVLRHHAVAQIVVDRRRPRWRRETRRSRRRHSRLEDRQRHRPRGPGSSRSGFEKSTVVFPDTVA